MIQLITDLVTGKAPAGARRSRDWSRVRSAHLVTFPECCVCGGRISLEVHHVVPFHEAPELELEPSNLMTLCERKKYGINCHLLVGHLGDYRRINPDVHGDAETWRTKLLRP